MKVATADLIKDKKVLLRLDLDIPIEDGKIIEDFRLKADLPTLNLCTQNASKVIIIGHLNRPNGSDPQFSLKPVYRWFKDNGFPQMTFEEDSSLMMKENLRFNPNEDGKSMDYAKELASQADLFVFEAFAAYHPAVSTTILPTLLPHAVGLRFAKEVETLLGVRNNPKHPLVAIMGGAKVEDKLPVINVLAQKADAVLVGGKLIAEIREQHLQLPANVLVGKLKEDGFDIAPETVSAWKDLIMKAAMIVWNGPLGKFEDPKNDQTKRMAEVVVSSSAQTVIGGGDIISALNQARVLDRISFVSTGGGAMLKLLSEGTLPTIDALS